VPPIPRRCCQQSECAAMPVLCLSPPQPTPIRTYLILKRKATTRFWGPEVGDGDRLLTMYGEDITPMSTSWPAVRSAGQLSTKRDVSGDGHMWSTAATVTDYTEKTWPWTHRGHERTYDFQGRF